MGLAKGIFMVETQTYAQRPQQENIDNSQMLLYHMEKYGVDMCVIKSSVGYSNEFNAEMTKKYPDKFIALCNDAKTQAKSQSGEVKWNIKDAVKEIDSLLATGFYKGIGEGMARDRTPKKKLISWDERLDQMCQIMEVARKYKCPVSYHTGLPIGAKWLDMARSRAHAEVADNGNPKHPYTEGLFNSLPNIRDSKAELKPIPGLMPDPTKLPPGCTFEPRCRYAVEACKEPCTSRQVSQTHSVMCSRYDEPDFSIELKRGEQKDV